jgi:hypothetical protein
VVTSHKQKQKWTAIELIHLVTQLPRLDFGASSLIRYWLLQKKHIHWKTFRASSLDFCTHRSMALTTSFKEYAQHHETKCVTFPQTLQKMITLFAKWSLKVSLKSSIDICWCLLFLFNPLHLMSSSNPSSSLIRGNPWKPSGHCMHLPTRPRCCSGAFHLWDMSCCNPYLAKCQAKNTRDTALNANAKKMLKIKMLKIWCFNVKRHALCWDYSRQGKGPADPCAKFGQMS